MSWPANAGQWNPGLAMTPDMSMASYTADQWTAMQQQNWQQWAQWQQQYAQWQSQYGEKYAQQMQAMQAMGGGPPLPAALPPAAPPPPDIPPPPAPHENNQPLYSQNKTLTAQPSPVPPPANRNSTPAPYSSTTGNNQNWSYEREQAAPQQTPVNAEALKKLAEEERLFDIQFQKWEEEIDKWRRENVNHPDKQAYKEYEAKFEACRLQLLERRSQMNQKKARLLGGAAPAAAAIPTNTGNISTAVPPPLQNNTNYNMPNNAQAQSFNNKIGNYSDNNTVQSFNDNKNTQNYPDKNAGQKYQDNRSANYQQYPDSNYNKNTNVDPKNRYDSYQGMEDYSQPGNYDDVPSKSSFLPQSSSNKGIPGLDLVPESEKAPQRDDDVIDITQEAPQNRGMPDYSTISKGINNILGDEKLMNILSSIRGQPPPGPPPVANNSQTMSTPNANIAQGVYNNPPPNNQWDRNNEIKWEGNNDNNQWESNNYNNQWNRNNDQNQYGNRQMPPNRQQDYGQNQNYQNQNYQNQNSYDDQGGSQDQWNYEDEGNYGQEENYGQERNYGQDVNQRGGLPPRENVPPPRGSGPPPRGNGPRPLMEVNLNMHDVRDVHDGYDAVSQRPGPPPPPRKPTWVEQPMFAPSIIVEYEHKPLRLKAREFIEPVHMFDYNHISKDGDNKKRDFEREADELFSRKPRDDDYDRYSRDRHYHRPPPDREGDRYARDQSSQFERRAPREERDDYRPRVPPRDDFERRYPDSRYDDRRRDDRDRDRNRRDDPYTRERDSFRERDRERDRERERERERDRLDRDRENRDRYRDSRRSRSRDKDSRKRALSKESAISIISDDSIQSNPKKPKDVDDKSRKHVVMIDDLLEPPGRDMRPAKIVIILRGPPGCGKSYLAKLIRDREAEHGGTARIMSIDDYFMQEGEVEEKDPTTGKIVKKPSLKYEYDSKLEDTYENSLKRAFKRSCTDGYFNFLIYDAVNDQLRSYADVWNFARQNGFQVYVCTMEMDAHMCYKRNIHNRSLEDIQVIISRFFPTPPHHIQLDATTLLQSAGITEVQMLDAEDDDDVIMEDVQHEVESVFTSKWEKMDDAAQLARLDGTNKPLRPSQLSMEDYLQLDDWKPNIAKPGKKTVRWADIEERRQQEKMRAIGFVVGQTDWNRMTDPTMGSSALTQTKYIERVRRT